MNAKKRLGLKYTIGAGALVLAAQACGSSAPTQQLVDARRAYDQAEMNPAARLTPDHLMTAHQALQVAEKAHHDDPGSVNEAHLAYLAERKSQQAIAYGKIAQAKQSAAQAKSSYVSTLEKDVSQGKDKLAQSEGARAAAEQERQAAQERAASALASLAEIGQVKQEQRGTVVTIPGAVLFEQGKSVLSSSAQQSLDKVASALQEQPHDNKIRIEGYTDARGSDELNDRLSQARAEAVRGYLVQQGLDASELEAVGRGKADPIASNDTPEGRATNRRVEIVIPSVSQQARSDQMPSGGIATSNQP
jgi:outer membrane protein OmpA-like peptidoglycan-associated protein